MLLAALAALQIAVPPPTGHVNDFAGVLDSASIRHMEAVARDIRAKTRGEIAVVTLDSLGDRPASDVAVQIGRQWGVGALAEAGDPAKNLGLVVLLVPLQNGQRGTGQIFIATGRGAEGFLPDSRVGRIRDAMIPYLAREEYGAGLVTGVDMLAAAFAQEFGVTLDSSAQPVAPVTEPRERRIPGSWLLILFVLLALFSRGRIFLLPFLLSGMSGGRRGRWGGGGWGGGGGRGWGGGGGFGGFGGGGGFSGGGAGGRF